MVCYSQFELGSMVDINKTSFLVVTDVLVTFSILMRLGNFQHLMTFCCTEQHKIYAMKHSLTIRENLPFTQIKMTYSYRLDHVTASPGQPAR